MASHRSSSLSSEELNLRIEEVESALARVSGSIQQLEDEAHEAKVTVSDSFEKHLAELHNRHVQLLRQVDVLYRERRNSLQHQLAQCNRLLGTLTTTQQYSEHLYKNRNFIHIQGIAGVKSFGNAGHLRLALDDNSLTSAITGFGKVDFDGFLVLPSEENKSKCLPSRVEEYQDDDTIVLNKPLYSESNTIEIRFPQLPKDYSYWLARKSADSNPSGSIETAPFEYRRTADDYKPCDVQTWLAHIQRETAAEPVEPDFPSCSSTASESIEIVSASDCLDKTSTVMCCQQPILNVEIENLAEAFGPCVIDKQKWLSPRSQNPSDVSVAKVCKANETCSSFDQCVCDTSCQEIALKNREEKERQSLKSKWLRIPNTKKSGDNAFQLPQAFGSNASYWLRPKPADHEPQSVTKIFPALDERTWLRSAATCTPTATPKTNGIAPGVEKQSWLRPSNTLSSSKDEANQQLKQTNHVSDWLLKRGAANQSWLREKPTNTTPLLQAIMELKQMRINERISDEETYAKWLLRRF